MLPLSGDNLTLDFTYPAFNSLTAVTLTHWVRQGCCYSPQTKTAIQTIKLLTAMRQMRLNTTGMLQQWYREGLIDKDAITTIDG